MATNILSIGQSALTAAQVGINTTGHNIANASTPGFKAKDLDFQVALQAAEGPGGLSAAQDLGGALRYRNPMSSSLDGNTVELSTEQTAFAENAIQYQTTLSFLNGRINTLTRALRGE